MFGFVSVEISHRINSEDGYLSLRSLFDGHTLKAYQPIRGSELLQLFLLDYNMISYSYGLLFYPMLVRDKARHTHLERYFSRKLQLQCVPREYIVS